MIRNLNMGITRRQYPDPAELQRRRAELLDNPPEPEPQPPPQRVQHLSKPPTKFQLREQALYGLAGQVVRTLAPHTEADPAAMRRLKRQIDDFYGERRHCVVPMTVSNGDGRLCGVYRLWSVDRVRCGKRCTMQRYHCGRMCAIDSGQA
jgi:hypothetical protein